MSSPPRVRAVAHDLRNLLQTVMGYAWAAGQTAESPVVRAHLSRVERAASDAIALVGQLTEDSAGMPSSGDSEIAPEVLELMALTRPTLAPSVKLDAQLDDPLRARIPPPDLRQVVLNLVLNASQALADQPGRISVRAFREGHDVLLEVSDDGPGIPGELAERVFRAGVTTRPGGTGQGLATVRELVERTGGRIELHAVTPHGARFLVRLPAAD